MASSPETDTASREIVTTRLLNAPREAVFAAWTDPKHIGDWWGPRGFTSTLREMNVKPGGVWRFVMHGSDGTDFPNRAAYSEVVKPERLVYVLDSDLPPGSEDPHRFDVVVTFAAEGNATRITMRGLFGTAAKREEVVTSTAKWSHPSGWCSSTRSRTRRPA